MILFLVESHIYILFFIISFILNIIFYGGTITVLLLTNLSLTICLRPLSPVSPSRSSAAKLS